MLQYDIKSLIKPRSPIRGQLSILNETFEIPKVGANVPTLLYNTCQSDSVGMLSIQVCSTFFVGRMFDKFSNIHPAKNF